MGETCQELVSSLSTGPCLPLLWLCAGSPHVPRCRTGRGWLGPGLSSPLCRDKRCRLPAEPRPLGVPMGVLSCVKYLMFIFNVLVFVSPPGPGGMEGCRGAGRSHP